MAATHSPDALPPPEGYLTQGLGWMRSCGSFVINNKTDIAKIAIKTTICAGFAALAGGTVIGIGAYLLSGTGGIAGSLLLSSLGYSTTAIKTSAIGFASLSLLISALSIRPTKKLSDWKKVAIITALMTGIGAVAGCSYFTATLTIGITLLYGGVGLLIPGIYLTDKKFDNVFKNHKLITDLISDTDSSITELKELAPKTASILERFIKW